MNLCTASGLIPEPGQQSLGTPQDVFPDTLEIRIPPIKWVRHLLSGATGNMIHEERNPRSRPRRPNFPQRLQVAEVHGQNMIVPREILVANLAGPKARNVDAVPFRHGLRTAIGRIAHVPG